MRQGFDRASEGEAVSLFDRRDYRIDKRETVIANEAGVT